jgi:hypothetical protein
MVRRIGDINEEKAATYYKRQGYQVWMPIKPRWGRMGQFRTRDILGAFDFIAINSSEIVFGQVKSDGRFRNAVEKEINAFVMPDKVYCEYWNIHDGDIKVRRYSGGVLSREYKPEF